MEVGGGRLQPVILSGGAGTRLWPLSRALHPKQYLSLHGDESLFQATVKRLNALDNAHPPLVVCNEEHRFMVAEQLRQLGAAWGGIYLEPVARNTAAAVAVAALGAQERDPHALLLVVPADHAIAETPRFCERIGSASAAARQGHLLTFGIPPDSPATQFGYIKAASAPVEGDIFKVEHFVEKPDLPTAERLLQSGGYFWNSGIFLFKASVYMDELRRYAPDIEWACRRAWDGHRKDLDFVRLDRGAMEGCPSESIDCAVMERTERACMAPLGVGWSDLGSWSALAEISLPDSDGNVTVGDVIHSDTKNCYLRAERRLLAAVGLRDQIVVETPDAVLVASREKASEVKALVQQLQTMRRDEAIVHQKVYRPWGFYEGITASDRFQVKHIMVNPGASLSLQKHHHRAEHWIVVKGTATVTCDERCFMLTEDQSTYVPIGSAHRLENHGKIPLELIEVQTGSYLGEDDIVRLEDVYGR